MNHSYIIIDDNQESVLETKAIAESFSDFTFSHPQIITKTV
jgi:hypothetical protein